MDETDVCDVFLNEDDVGVWEKEERGQLRVTREAVDFAARVAVEAEGDRKLNAGDFERLWEGRGVHVIGCKEFPYSDGGKLQGDDRLVEREYWLRVPGSKEYVVLHVHFEGRWNSKYWLRHKDIVLQANVRHSVTAAKPTVPVYYDKCKDLDTWREEKGTPVRDLPPRWSWKTNPKVHEGLAALLRKGEQCTTFVRSLGAGEALKSRHALVIAVGEYQSQSIKNLPNAVNDGVLLKETLEALGWDVEMLVNPTRGEARAKLMDFFRKSENWKDAVLFAFFGHGIEPWGSQQNLLVMNDTEIPEEASNALEFEKMMGDRCVNLFKIMPILNTSREEAGFPPTIAILDCCRDQLEPRVRSLSSSQGGRNMPSSNLSIYRGGGAGPEFKNLITIYSTTSGNTAGDGRPGGNGPFMAKFHSKILQPGLELSDALREVNQELGDQVPVPKGMLVTKFYFAGEIEKVVVDPRIGGDPVGAASGVAAVAAQHGDNDDNYDGVEVREWLYSIKGISKQGQQAVWEMLVEEEFCTMEAVCENIEDIMLSESFANLKMGTRTGLTKALETLRLSKAGVLSVPEASPPVESVLRSRIDTAPFAQVQSFGRVDERLIPSAATRAAQQGVTKRALIFAVNKYDNDSFPTMTTSIFDAQNLASALKELGWKVDLYEDPTLQVMMGALSKFIGDLSSADPMLFGYIGHGFELEGQLYLMPRDADLPVKRMEKMQIKQTKERVDRTCLQFADLEDRIARLRRMSDTVASSVFLLDMSSNNMMTAILQEPLLPGTLRFRGCECRNSAIILCTPEGMRNKGGPFMTALVSHIQEPLVDIMMKLRRQLNGYSIMEIVTLEEPVYFGNSPPIAQVDGFAQSVRPPAATTCSSDALTWG